MSRVYLIDNYDSFTWNLWHLFGKHRIEAGVIRNDAMTAAQLLAREPAALILSPGPATPDKAGMCLELLAQAPPMLPVFGVCLGMQAICQAAGASVIPAKQIVHGKVWPVTLSDHPLFRGIDQQIMATRYHSLTVSPGNDRLRVIAKTADNTIMAVADTAAARYGVQFHPESVGTRIGGRIIENFIRLARLETHTKRTDATG